MSKPPSILILTPVKDAVAHLDGYFAGLERLSYPRARLSLGMLESDSADGTFAALQARLPALRSSFAAVAAWKKDFGYRLPPNRPRWWPQLQLMRRAALARSRNHLLSRALNGCDWVLWLDVDVIEHPPDIIERLLATGKRIVQPNCVLDYGGASFDRNAWRGPEKAHLSDLRDEGDLVPLDSVGGSMLLIAADIHRDGLIFPPFPYGAPGPALPRDTCRIETEGLGLMARDMGHRLWGMPNLEIRHHPG